jgi:hypothetical protein
MESCLGAWKRNVNEGKTPLPNTQMNQWYELIDTISFLGKVAIVERKTVSNLMGLELVISDQGDYYIL